MRAMLAVLAFAIVSATAWAKDSPQQAFDLLQQASKLQNLKADGAQPFHLRLGFRFTKLRSGKGEGSYLLIWAAPHKWREEIRLGEFEEISVGGVGKRWTTLNRGIELEPVRTLKTLVQVFGFAPSAHEQPQKMHERRREGATLRCVEWTSRELDTKGEKCFDATGALVLEAGPRMQREYQDYAVFGAKKYPHTLLSKDPQLSVEARVEELAALPDVSDAWFMPPDNAEEWPTCDDTQPPKVISSPDPEAPRNCIASGTRWDVGLQVVVGADGRPSQVLVASSGGFDYDAAAVQAVQGWRFRPALCGKTPIKAQIRIEVNFRCGGY